MTTAEPRLSKLMSSSHSFSISSVSYAYKSVQLLSFVERQWLNGGWWIT